MSIDFGGHMRFTFNGAPLTIRGKFELDDSDYSFTATTNEDGSVSTVAKPTARILTVDFEDSNPGNNSRLLDWNAFMLGGPYNIMLAEEDTGVLHSISGAKPSGRPKRDRLTGMVTGIELHVPRGGYNPTAS